MNTELFFKETTPLTVSVSDQRKLCCNSLSPNQRYQLKKAGVIIGGLCFSAILLYNVYDAVKTFEARPLKISDCIFSGVELTLTTIAFLYFSALGGSFLAWNQNNYEDLVESYPEQSFQGSLTNYIEQHFQSSIRAETGKQYIPAFIHQFDPILLNRYFLIKEVENDQEKRIEYLSKKLKRGCCFGYAMALLAKMKNHAKSSSEELLESLCIENIVYFQLTNHILYTLRNDPKSWFYPTVYNIYHESERNFTLVEYMDANEEFFFLKTKDRLNSLSDETSSDKTDDDVSIVDNQLTEAEEIEEHRRDNLYKHERLFFNFCGFDSAGIYIHDVKNQLKINELCEHNLSDHFDTAKQAISKEAQTSHNLDQMTLAGYIRIDRPEKEDQKGSAHAIFFQMSDGFFRFFDSGSWLNHFFEFPTQKLMFEGIQVHMKKCWGSFKEGDFKLILVGIPHQKLVIN